MQFIGQTDPLTFMHVTKEQRVLLYVKVVAHPDIFLKNINFALSISRYDVCKINCETILRFYLVSCPETGTEGFDVTARPTVCYRAWGGIGQVRFCPFFGRRDEVGVLYRIPIYLSCSSSLSKLCLQASHCCAQHIFSLQKPAGLEKLRSLQYLQNKKGILLFER